MSNNSEDLVLFGNAAAQWRHLRGLSQHNLGKAIGHSQRHVSFLENGRAKPSRRTVERLVRVLEIPPRDGNRLLNLLGYREVFEEVECWVSLEPPLRGFRRLLVTGLHPCFAAVVDDAHRLVMVNLTCAVWLTRIGLDGAREPESMFQNGMLHFPSFLFHPEGMKRQVRNWEAFARAYLQGVLRQRLLKPEAAEKVISDIRNLADLPDDWFVLNDGDNDTMRLEWNGDTAVGELAVRYVPFAVETRGVHSKTVFPEFSVDLFRPADPSSEKVLNRLCETSSRDDVHPLLRPTLVVEEK